LKTPLSLAAIIFLSTLACDADTGNTTPATPSAPAPFTLNVWPGTAPGETGNIGAEYNKSQQYFNVTIPTLTVYPAPADKATGAAVLVCPGGGYQSVYASKEGIEPCQWLNSLGITAVLLKYRVPNRPGEPRYLAALQDAQRSMSILRSHAKDWNLDPTRIGMMGFSAGGQMTADVSTNFTKLSYPPIDAVDQVSNRPDFAILAYPGGLVQKGADHLTATEVTVTNDTPPSFIVIADNDQNGSANAVYYYLLLRQAGVHAELHVYGEGAHGFGMRPGPHPHNSWPQRLDDWLVERGILKAPSPAPSTTASPAPATS
jgi:acetyl esterase/lipase